MQFVNLKKIIQYVHEAELDSKNYLEDRFATFYENDRRHLNEILDAVGFVTDLIKDENGEYQIPKDDGELFEWMIKETTSKQMKLIRNGNFYNAGPEYLYKIITGLKKVLIDAGKDEVVVAQMDIIMERTEYNFIVRLSNIRAEMESMLNNFHNFAYNPTFHVPYAERCEYLDEVIETIKNVKRELDTAFMDKKRYHENNACENVVKLSQSDLKFSDRSLSIMEELHSNSKYMELRNQLDTLESKKQPLLSYEKKRSKIIKEITEILNVTSKDYPINIDEITILERLMYTTEDGFCITHKSGDDGWYVRNLENYKMPGRRL